MGVCLLIMRWMIFYLTFYIGVGLQPQILGTFIKIKNIKISKVKRVVIFFLINEKCREYSSF
jgi:hypothetical protein